MKYTIMLARQPNGDFIDWGRHAKGGVGSARYYGGEAAEVLRLVLDSSPDRTVHILGPQTTCT